MTAPIHIAKDMQILVVMRDALRGEGVASVLRDVAGDTQIRLCDKSDLLKLAVPQAAPWTRLSSRIRGSRAPRCTPCIAVSRRPRWSCAPSHADAATHRALFAAGVAAIVSDDATPDVIAAAVQLALCGNVSVHARCLWQAALPSTGPTRRTVHSDLNLTLRQFDVLPLIAQGRPNKAIADTLGIGLRTVKGHVAVILRAFNADNRRDAGRHARRWLARNATLAKSADAQRSRTGPRHTNIGIR